MIILNSCVHADSEGASVVLVKNPFTTKSTSIHSAPPPPGITDAVPIPPLTLHQAGTMSLVHSKAWDSKTVTAPWWIKAEQVELQSGGLLGALTFRGKKTFLASVLKMINKAKEKYKQTN